MVVVADFRAAETAEIFFCHVRASAVRRIGLFVVHAAHFKAGVQVIPCLAFVRIHDRSLGDAGLNPRERRPFGTEHCRERLAVTLTDDNDRLTLAGLVERKATVAAVFAMVGRLHITAEVAAVDFRRLAFAADGPALQFLCHCFAHFVRENEGALVREAEIAGERQSGLALHFITEDRNRREIVTEWALVAGEQRAGRDREILPAGFAAIPGRHGRASSLVSIQSAANGANRSALGILPANFAERRFRLCVRKPENVREADRLGFGGKEEMLAHWYYSSVVSRM